MRGEKRAQRLNGGAGLEARESELRFVSQMTAVEKLYSVRVKLKKMKEDRYSLTTSLQPTQEELERVSKESKEKNSLIESLRKAARARNVTKNGLQGGRKK